MKISDVKESAGELVHAAEEQARDCVDAGRDAIKSIGDKATQIGKKTDGYVRENPWIAIGAAAGVGLIVGFLLTSRRKS